MISSKLQNATWYYFVHKILGSLVTTPISTTGGFMQKWECIFNCNKSQTGQQTINFTVASVFWFSDGPSTLC